MTKWLNKKQLFKEVNPDDVPSGEESIILYESVYNSSTPANEFRTLMELGRQQGRKMFLTKHTKKKVNVPVNRNKKTVPVLMKGEQRNKITPSNKPLSNGTATSLEINTAKAEQKLTKEALRLKMLEKRNRELNAVITSVKCLRDSKI